MYRISKEFKFEAAHQLDTLPEGHQCKRLHGHSYRVVLVFEGDELDEHGFLFDYAELDVLKRYIDDNLDHRYLNDILDVPPTAENLAQFFYDLCVEYGFAQYLLEARVSETQKTWAIYSIPEYTD